ncbi:hypothetical protein CARUB_v10021569mg [Capsella rubella]|uniref:Uncharacterized protein n=1 Tax=Capsella rubella TaxID=81985 RepID=R0I7M6_9BRAS|nr:hypothetical protein CARUB_v10021569mg [Capsella rubella]
MFSFYVTNIKPNCNGKGSACLDPRFIGGDEVVYYFHGKRDENFALISDVDFQVNACFIGLRPSGRSRDFTWIQSLGLIFGHNIKTFSLEVTKAAKWDDQVDHLGLSFEGKEISLAKGDAFVWSSSRDDIKIERISEINSVLVTLQDIAEIWVNVVPVTKEDDIIHRYGRPKDDCFAPLEVQFRFLKLSKNVEGVLGRTYRKHFKNPAKQGVAARPGLRPIFMIQCGLISLDKVEPLLLNQSTGGSSSGVGIFCRKQRQYFIN